MNRWNIKRKRWLDRKSRQGNRRTSKRNQVFRDNSSESSAIRVRSDNNTSFVMLTPPKNFSLTDNAEETMRFFADFAKEIERKMHGMHFFIDSRDVERVTVDALIYLIAILQNDTVNHYMKYSFSGNYPRNKEANRIYKESGFTDYVVSKMRELPESTDKMRIISGTNNSPAAAKELSDFVMHKLGKNRKDIQPIQKVLIELMSNVYHHAYEKNMHMAKKWYMYAEHIDNYIRCVFVDTGFGIAKTVRKNFTETIQLKLGMRVNDAKIIRSIFNGKFRTGTNEFYRGNGLLAVRENVKADIFESFEVISGRGRCIIPKEYHTEEIISESYDNSLYGTLYQFIIQ